MGKNVHAGVRMSKADDPMMERPRHVSEMYKLVRSSDIFRPTQEKLSVLREALTYQIKIIPFMLFTLPINGIRPIRIEK